jgi:hypothetical protein
VKRQQGGEAKTMAQNEKSCFGNNLTPTMQRGREKETPEEKGEVNFGVFVVSPFLFHPSTLLPHHSFFFFPPPPDTSVPSCLAFTSLPRSAHQSPRI